MITVKKEKVVPNMILAEDLFGANKLVLRAGTVLTPRFISLLQINNLFPVEQIKITDESYNITLLKVTNEMMTPESGEEHDSGNDRTFFSRFNISQIKEGVYVADGDLSDCSEQLHIPGDLSVGGDIRNCSSIFVSGTLTVRGSIFDSNLSVKKDVAVSKNISNSSRNFKIHAFGLISAQNIERSQIDAGFMQVAKSIVDSDLVVDSNIEGPTSENIQNSKLQAGNNIILGAVNEGTTLVIFSDKQSKIMQKLFEVEKRIREFDKEIDPLRQSIRIFQLLKDRLHELPIEKKDKLLSNVRLVKTKLEKKKFFESQYVNFKQESDKIRKSRESGPIIIEANVVKGTRIIIDNSTFVVQTQDRGVVFYKKSIIIMGKKDKEWGRLS